MAQQLGSNYYNSPFKFNGKELDEETGFYYYGARYYDPKISIWLSVDPLAEKFPNFNPYNYVMQNPLNLIDPTGMAPEEGGATDPPKGGSPIVSLGTGKEVVVVGERRYNGFTSEMVNGQYGYGGTLEQWIKEYGIDAYNNYSAEDELKWHKEVNLKLIKESNDAELMHKFSFFKNGFEALSYVVAPTQAINSFASRGLAKTFSYKPRYSLAKVSTADDVFLVTQEGVVLPKGYKIPSDYIQNPFRSSSFGTMREGKFIERIRFDPATAPGFKGPNYSHFHLNGSGKHSTNVSKLPK